MNWDEGSYQLSRTYNDVLDTTADHRVKIQKNWVPASSYEGLRKRSKRQRFLVLFWLCNLNLVSSITSKLILPTIGLGSRTHSSKCCYVVYVLSSLLRRGWSTTPAWQSWVMYSVEAARRLLTLFWSDFSALFILCVSVVCHVIGRLMYTIDTCMTYNDMEGKY